jgi:ABC-type xylose transport system permease subunit
MSNVFVGLAKIMTAIVCFFLGLLIGALEVLFYDKRRHNLDS